MRDDSINAAVALFSPLVIIETCPLHPLLFLPPDDPDADLCSCLLLILLHTCACLCMLDLTIRTWHSRKHTDASLLLLLLLAWRLDPYCVYMCVSSLILLISSPREQPSLWTNPMFCLHTHSLAHIVWSDDCLPVGCRTAWLYEFREKLSDWIGKKF